MLLRLFFTALLEGGRLGPATLRRPVPVIWFDRVREVRARRNVARITRDLSQRAPQPPRMPGQTETRVAFHGADTVTRAGCSGWGAALVVESAS